jgi:hypothetical protein
LTPEIPTFKKNKVNPGVTMTNLQKSGGMGGDAYEAFIAR